MKHFAIVLSLVALAGCARRPPQVAEPEPEPETGIPFVSVSPDVVAVEPARPLRQASDPPRLEDMTLRDKVAQLIMPWIGGEYWPADAEAMTRALALVSEDRVGGFVTGVGASPYDLAAKFNTLQRASRYPLLIAADLESGPAMRIRGGTAFSGNMALGATGREEDAYAVGRVIAEEARAIGVHMDFAPVVDVNNNPSNPIINTRSFGEDPGLVGRMGVAFIRGLRAGGVLSTAKHFPGHGDTGTDSHIALPVIRSGRGRLDSIELAPFRAAVAAGVEGVMSAHIALPGLTGDSALPATLSPLLLDTILRGQLGFRGLVITDALNMGAVVSRYGAAQAAVLAFKAGADILLMPTDVRAAIDAIVDAVHRNEIRMERLNASVGRIIDAKERAGLFRRRYADLGGIARAVGSREHQATADAIARRSIVLVRDDSSMVPLTGTRRRALVVALNDEGSTSTGTAFAAELRRGAESVRVVRLFPGSGPASYDSVRAAAADAGSIIVIASPRPVSFLPGAVAIPDSAASLVQQLSAAGRPVIFVSAGSPYILTQIPLVPAYVVAWSGADVAERAAAGALLGWNDIGGCLPVRVPPLQNVCVGLARSGRPPVGTR